MILTSNAEFQMTFGDITLPKGPAHVTAEEEDEGYLCTVDLSDDQLALLQQDPVFVEMLADGKYSLTVSA
jgi:hypothetical protein